MPEILAGNVYLSIQARYTYVVQTQQQIRQKKKCVPGIVVYPLRVRGVYLRYVYYYSNAYVGRGRLHLSYNTPFQDFSNPRFMANTNQPCIKL